MNPPTTQDPGLAKVYTSVGWAARRAASLRFEGYETEVRQLATGRWGLYIHSLGWLFGPPKDARPPIGDWAKALHRAADHLDALEDATLDGVGLGRLTQALAEIARVEASVHEELLRRLQQHEALDTGDSTQ